MKSTTGGQMDRGIISSIMATLRNGETHYVEVPGNAKLRTQIGAYLNDAGVASGGNILITAGVQEARFLTVQVLGKALGKVAFPKIIHPGVREVLAVRNLDHIFVEIGTDQRMLVPPAAVKKLADSVKVLYVESPSRFTGASYQKDELDEIVSLCKKHDIALIIDSGLSLLVESRDLSESRIEIDDSLFIIGEAWPGCGLDDLYIGYILTSEEMVKKISTQKQVISICTSAPSQNGALAAGNSYQQKHMQIIANLTQKRMELEKLLKELGVDILSSSIPSLLACESDKNLQEKLDAADIRYEDGSYYGAPGYMQLAVQ